MEGVDGVRRFTVQFVTTVTMDAGEPVQPMRSYRGRSETEAVPRQHARASFPVEGQADHAGDLRESRLRREAPAAHGLPVLWPVRSAWRAASSPGSLSTKLSDRAVSRSDGTVSRIDDEFHELGIVIEPGLMELALTHRSWAYENGKGPTNERLEFLGDSVLGLVVTEHLYRRFADQPEGRLARLRAAVVSGQSLAQVGRRLEIGPLIKLGHGEVITNGSDKDSILADTMEAIIGAVHLSSSFATSERLVHHWMDPVIEEASGLGAGLDWKSSLQELTAGRGLGAPDYACVGTGPDHERVYEACVTVGDTTYGPGAGTSKRAAEQIAAEMAYRVLEGERPEQ